MKEIKSNTLTPGGAVAGYDNAGSSQFLQCID